MEYRDYYAVLGVPRTASKTDIKKAFRKLARAHHPDTKPGDTASERRFKEVNEANAVLSDPEKRALYDRLGADWEAYARAGATAGARSGAGAGTRPSGGPFANAGGSGGPGGGIRYEFRTSGDADGFSDFFEAFFGGASSPTGATSSGPGRGRRATGGPTFEEILADMGLRADGTSTGARPAGGGSAAGDRDRAGTRSTNGRAVRAGPAAEALAEITLDEAYHGTTRLIDLDGKRLEVTIPKGADTGTRVRLSGRAPGGGDVHVVIKQAPDPVFTRRGADLDRELPVTLQEALLGAEVPVKTPKGRVLLTIPAGTQTGRTFRLTGRGLPRLKGEGFGDVFVRTRVLIPTNLSDEAREAAQRFLDVAPQPDPRTRET